MKQNIMIQGTMSSAGKSLICAALCRIFTQDGFKTAPFKSQNMALNSFITEDGAEMGRAQVMQAEAAKIRPDARMNPILLKPTSDVGSQVIVNGHVLGNMPAASYFKYKKQLVPEIMKAYRSLEEEYDIIVIEGAGSPAEINLKKNDIVNMGMAKMVDAPVLLAGDIDRGGVFAQLYGTVALLEEEERNRVKGLIINKFRGDVEILKPGLATLEELTKIPVAGVIPWIYAKLDDEDSLAPRLSRVQAGAGVDIAVVRLPHISNFTDFNPLEQQPGISLRYAGDVKTLGQPDMVIVPGSKNTMSDLKWMRQNGMEAAILKLAAANVPVLGICYGSQLMMHLLGGHVCRAPEREYGKTEVFVDNSSKMFADVQLSTICWMSHNDYIEQAAPDFKVTAHTVNCPVAAAENEAKGLYAVQFHPEVLHTAEGKKMLRNFVYNVCGCVGDWKMDSFVEHNVQALREKIGSGKVLCALSGGVDSSVLAAMLAKAIGKQLTCVFVDHGLLRKNEKEEVCAVFGPGNANGFDINFICVDARERYFSKLAGVTEPERKRKIIGEEFIRVFEEEAKKIGKVDFLAQGTIYPDVVESGLGGESAVIKSHHNVGGLPDTVDFKELVEPLRNLFKDEVRQAGRELGLPEYLVSRQPFPGPGLGIRIIGEVTPEKVAIVQDADAIWREEIAKAGLDKEINQYYAALTNMRSVGVMGDERTYDYAVALRAVTTTDFMTAESYNMPWDVLGTVTSRIVNEVKHVNRVFYDCTGKPPATIELE